MDNSFTQLYIHIIIAVKGKQNYISVEYKSGLYKYITDILSVKQHTLMAINGGPDHIHLLVNVNPEYSISEIINYIKAATSQFINKNKFQKENFEWQDGFVAFSVSKSRIMDLIEYIGKQETHHTKKTFKEEYLDFLNKYGINFDEKFIFSDN